MITVASFNVKAGVDPDCNAIHRLLKKEQVNVVGMQELDRNTNRTPVDMPKLIAQNDYHSYFTETVPLRGGSYGIASFADQPLESAIGVHYPTTGEEPRAYQRFTYQLDGRPVAVYNTHLAFETERLRQQQVAVLLEAIAQDPLDDCIVTGDFNMDQSHSEWDDLAAHLQMANGAAGRWLETFTWRDANMKVFAIDNILVSAGLQLKNVHMADTILSDHQMLVAQVGWRN